MIYRTQRNTTSSESLEVVCVLLISLSLLTGLGGCVHTYNRDNGTFGDQTDMESTIAVLFPWITNNISIKCEKKMVGEVVAALTQDPTGSRSPEILVDARFSETRVDLVITNVRCVDVLKQVVDLHNLAVSPSGEVLYVGRTNDAERARNCARVLRRYSPESNRVPWCTRVQPGHLCEVKTIPGEMWLETAPPRIEVDVPRSDVRGAVQGVAFDNERWASDYYWAIVAVSSTAMTNNNGILAILPVGSKEEGNGSTSAWTRSYWKVDIEVHRAKGS